MTTKIVAILYEVALLFQLLITIGSSRSASKPEVGRERILPATVLSSNMQMLLSMGFSYLQAVEAYSIFGDDLDSMVCYLLETSNASRRKGKATE